jgi:hypothetical protein
MWDKVYRVEFFASADAYICGGCVTASGDKIPGSSPETYENTAFVGVSVLHGLVILPVLRPLLSAGVTTRIELVSTLYF